MPVGLSPSPEGDSSSLLPLRLLAIVLHLKIRGGTIDIFDDVVYLVLFGGDG